MPFVAIIMFVTFGIAIFAGFGWSGTAVSRSIDSKLEKCNFHDYEVMFTVPVSEENIETFEKKDGIDSVEGSNICYRFFDFNDKKAQAKIESVTTEIDKLYQIEGQLPVRTGEIVVEKTWAKGNDVSIGDKISFEPEGVFSALEDDEFTVCGLAESPEYISAIAAGYEASSKTSTPVDCIMFVSEEAFNTDLFNGYSKLILKSRRSSEEIEHYLKDICGKDAEYTVFTVSNNASLSISKVIIDMFGDLKLNMALMFIITGILVCFSSVSRLVYKDIELVGTKKALGFRQREITVSYLLYAGAASVIGCVLGILIARFAIESLFLSVLSDTYLFEPPVFYFSISEALFLSAVEMLCTGLAAYIACASTLKMNTVTLLAGGDPSENKIKWFEHFSIWQRTPLFTKCIINNLITDSRRVRATLIGIAGCTALIVCGITFSNSINDSFDYQFDKIQKYKGIVSYDSQFEEASENIADILENRGIGYATIYSSMARLKTPDGDSVVASLNVGNEDLDDMITPFTHNGERHSVKEGIWLSCAFADNYGIEAGDTVTYVDAVMTEHTVTIAGVYEYYMQCPKLLFSEDAYEKEYGALPNSNAMFVTACGAELEELAEELEDVDGFVASEDYYATMFNSFSIITGISSAIMYLYVALAVLMAVFVLLDLFVMFVEEKKRELIILMINGYTLKHARKYIYSDTVLLTIIGIILGIAAGVIMGHININSMMSDISYYLNRINFFACFIAAASAVLLILLMIRTALKRIDNFELTDLNK